MCVCTAAPAVGDRVPHAEAGVGAIATQARTSILYGTKGLTLLKTGFSPRAALEATLKEDLQRESRQVIIIDKDGKTAAFTGKKTIDWKGHFTGTDYVVAGNMIVGGRVLDTMIQAFKSSEDELEERLMKALEAGQEAGGDKRGKTSAALLVVRKEQVGTCPFLDLRVDGHREPVKELRRKLINT